MQLPSSTVAFGFPLCASGHSGQFHAFESVHPRQKPSSSPVVPSTQPHSFSNASPKQTPSQSISEFSG